MERDVEKPLGVWDFEDFNSHAHVERDTIGSACVAEFFNFNSHAHVERDISVGCVDNRMGISTHTLTWSVTCIYSN